MSLQMLLYSMGRRELLKWPFHSVSYWLKRTKKTWN